MCPAEDRIVSCHELDLATEGHVPIVLDEFSLVEEIVHQDERWLARMRERGLTDLSQLRVNPLSAGVPATGETGRRIQRCFTFVQKTARRPRLGTPGGRRHRRRRRGDAARSST